MMHFQDDAISLNHRQQMVIWLKVSEQKKNSAFMLSLLLVSIL